MLSAEIFTQIDLAEVEVSGLQNLNSYNTKMELERPIKWPLKDTKLTESPIAKAVKAYFTSLLDGLSL